MAPKTAHRFIAKAPVQHCRNCCPSNPEPTPILRSQLQGWRITCPIRGHRFHGSTTSDRGAAFAPHRDAALRGEKLVDDETERRAKTWAAPIKLARLLLMRRVPWPLPNADDLWRFRVLGLLIPKLDAIPGRERSFPCSPKHPILPLHIRPALLAGVAIVVRSGPEMLRMLQGHTFGENRNRFIKAVGHLVFPAFEWGPPRQLQLI